MPTDKEVGAVTSGKFIKQGTRLRISVNGELLFVTVLATDADLDDTVIHVYTNNHQKWLTLQNGYYNVEILG